MFSSAGVDLSGVQMAGATLTDVALTNLKIVGADLSKANLANANLDGANLTQSDLSDAILKRSNLKDAVLSHVQLKGADLSQTELTGTRWDHAVIDRRTVFTNAWFGPSHPSMSDYSDTVQLALPAWHPTWATVRWIGRFASVWRHRGFRSASR